MRIHDRRGYFASVGLAHQEGRIGAGPPRVVVIGDQFRAVGHVTANASFEAYSIAAID
jgi:hypothetical protein